MSVTVIGAEQVAASFLSTSTILRTTSRQAVEVSARKVKDDAKRRISGHTHLTKYPYSITYDLHTAPTGPWAEIGPDKTRTQGPLGNIIEFGTRNNPPLSHLHPALVAVESDFLTGMDRAVAQAIR